MSWVVTSIVVTVAATAYSAETQRQASKQEGYNLEQQADREELSAENEEIKRRERLNKVLAANVRSASSAGILGEGSPKSVSLEAARRASSSEGAESLSQSMRQDLLKREGKAIKSAGKRQAASTLLTGAGRVAQLSK